MLKAASARYGPILPAHCPGDHGLGLWHHLLLYVPLGSCRAPTWNPILIEAVNRLDRLTSGLMILALNSKSSRDLANEFVGGHVKKEYVARVKGKFPE